MSDPENIYIRDLFPVVFVLEHGYNWRVKANAIYVDISAAMCE